jgi:hypothetical protein
MDQKVAPMAHKTVRDSFIFITPRPPLNSEFYGNEGNNFPSKICSLWPIFSFLTQLLFTLEKFNLDT